MSMRMMMFVCSASLCILVRGPYACVGVRACAQIPRCAHMCVCRVSAETQRGCVLEPVVPCCFMPVVGRDKYMLPLFTVSGCCQ